MRDDGADAALAEFVCGLDVAGIPTQVVEHGSVIVADAVACGIRGSRTPTSEAARAVLSTDGSSGPAQVWGSSHRQSTSDAILLNATSVDALDADDATGTALIHVGPVVAVPALHWAAAKQVSATAGDGSGRRLLAAVVAGCEVGAVVGRACGLPMLQSGFHPAPITGAIAAAVTSAHLLGLDVDGMRHAVGIAASLGAGLMGAQRGAMVKAVHLGRAAQAGHFAALAAANGMTGVQRPFADEYGSFTGAYGSTARLAEGAADLGRVWRTTDVEIKYVPAGASTYAPVDAIRDLQTEGFISTPASVHSVEVRVPTVTHEHGGWPFDPAEGPGSARMNIAWCVAAQIRWGQVNLASLSPEALDDPMARDIAARVVVIADEGLDQGGIGGRHRAIVDVVTDHGRQRVELARGNGSSAHPVDPGRFAAKLTEFVDPSCGRGQGAALLREAQALRESGSARAFAERWLNAA